MKFGKDKLGLFIINITYLLVLFNAPLTAIGIKYGYLIMYVGTIIFFLSGKLSAYKLKIFALHIFFVFLMILLLCLALVFNGGGSDAVIAFGLYSSPIVIWILFSCSNSTLTFPKIFRSTYLLTVIVAYLGIIQYFISPTLFGFLPIDSMAMKWASGQSFNDYAVFFRATSTLGSPQVFGLFCALNLILTVRFRKIFSSKIFYIGLIGLTFGGALSANKSFILIVILYFLLNNFRTYLVSFRSIAVFGILGFLIISNSQLIIERLPILERVVSVNKVIEQEASDGDGRIARYSFILSNANPIIGEGLGSITNKSIYNLKAAESYYLKLYYEAGMLIMIFFIFLNFISLYGAFQFNPVDAIIVMLIMLSMIIVHAFESPAFLIVWCYFLGFALNLGKKNIFSFEKLS